MKDCLLLFVDCKGVFLGVVVNGGEISPELYMEMQSHQVYDSFDESGYLVHDDMFNELETSIEERLLDDGDSRLVD